MRQLEIGSGRGACLVAFALVSGAAPSPVAAAGILNVYDTTLTAYKPTAPTAVQDTMPLSIQRGVNLDGSLRAGPLLPIALAGNPFANEPLPSLSEAGVLLAPGTPVLDAIDLAPPAPGFRWMVGRSFNARQYDGSSYVDSDGPQGINWRQDSLPEIVFYDDADDAKDAVYLVYGADRYVEFVRSGSATSEFTARNGASGTFQQVARATLVYQTLDDGATRRFTYDYTSGRLDSVTVAEKPSAGSYTDTGESVAYSYYGSESYGDPGDLKLVAVTTPLSDSGVTLVRHTYYRYYEGTYNATTNPGHPHQVMYVWKSEGLRRFDWTDSTFDQDYLTASNDDLKTFASSHFKYDSDRRVVMTWANGACGCGGGVNGEYDFEYGTSSTTPTSGYDTDWRTRTTVTLPPKTDLAQAVSAYSVHYFDETGQALHLVVTDGDPAGGTAPAFWATKVTRDSGGRVTQLCTPANASAYAHSTGSITSRTDAGLVRAYVRVSSGDMEGFVQDSKHQTGTSGSAYLDGTLAYASRSLTVGAATVVRPVLTSVRGYVDEITSGTSGSLVTTLSNDPGDWWSSTATDVLYLARKKVVTTFPAVSGGNNGSGSATSATDYLRKDRSVAFREATDGVFSYAGLTNGLPTTTIADCQTNSATYGASDDPNGVWGVTESGSGLHKVTTNTYDAQGRLVTSTAPDGQVRRSYRSRLADRRTVELEYPDYESTPKWHGPVSYTVTNHAGAPEVVATVALASNESTLAQASHVDEGDADPITAMDLGTIVRMQVSLFDDTGSRRTESRAYFSVPSSGAGTDGTHYDPTLFAYDGAGRLWRVKEPSGTIQRTVFDPIGRKSAEWLGTNDNDTSGDNQFPGGETTGTLNMVKVGEVAYDGGYPSAGSPGGNGYLTGNTAHVDGSGSGAGTVTYTLNVFGQPVVISNPQGPHTVIKYDNLGRAVAAAEYSSTSGLSHTSDPTSLATNRISLIESAFDEWGREWKAVRHKIDPSDGSDDDTLETRRWFDSAGRLVKEDGPQLVKYAYDRLGRTTRRYVLASDDDSSYSDVKTVSGDIVLSEEQTVYDATEDTVVLNARIDRFHGDAGGGQTTGALDTNADGDDRKYTASDIKGRIQITASWHDRFGRQTDSVDFGTNAGATFDLASYSTPPARSATALRTTWAYGTDGGIDTTTDPRGIAYKELRDAEGRVVADIRNYVDGTPSGSPTTATSVDDNYTRYAYVDGLRTKQWIDLDGDGTEDADDQVTVFSYGTAKGTSAGDSKIATGNLLHTVQHADSSGGTDVVTFAYDAQRKPIWVKDQAGNVVEVSMDTRGRRTDFDVTTLASGFDGAVRRIALTYDSRSRISKVTQYDSPTHGSGTVVNEVAYSYDDWGNRSKVSFDRDSAVATSGGNEYSVSQSFAKATGGRNTLRRTSMSIPGTGTGSSASVSFAYSGTGSHDDNASRVSSIAFDGTTVVEYAYLGVASLVGTDYPEPDVFSHRYSSTAGAYPDLDRFNRVTTDRWTKDLATDRDFYRVVMTYDENGNPTRAEDQIRTNGATGHFDVKYTLDEMNRLTRAEQGDWNGSAIASLRRDDAWQDATLGGLDQAGNWVRHKLDKDGNGNYTGGNDLDETRTHSDANELLTRNTNSGGPVEYTLSFDAVGNMTDDGKSYTYEYDAFGRLVRLRNRSTAALVAEYAYYGNWNRASEKYDTDGDGDVDGSDLTYHFAYDDAWRLVATFRGSDSQPKEQFLPHLAGLGGMGGSVGLDAVVLRNRDANSAWTSACDGTLEQRRYYCQSWRGDVVALLTDTGAPVEDVRYGPYGEPFGMYAGDVDDDGDVDANDRSQVQAWITSSAYDVRGDLDRDGDVDVADRNAVSANNGKNMGWGVLSYGTVGNRRGFAGYEADLVGPQIAHARLRVYLPELGRWASRDPVGLDAFGSLYSYISGYGQRFLDPLGLAATPPMGGGSTPVTDPGGVDLSSPPGTGQSLDFILCPDFTRFGDDFVTSGFGHGPSGSQLAPGQWYAPPGTMWAPSIEERWQYTRPFSPSLGFLLTGGSTKSVFDLARPRFAPLAEESILTSSCGRATTVGTGGGALIATVADPYAWIFVLSVLDAMTLLEIREMTKAREELAKPTPRVEPHPRTDPGEGGGESGPDDPKQRPGDSCWEEYQECLKTRLVDARSFMNPYWNRCYKCLLACNAKGKWPRYLPGTRMTCRYWLYEDKDK